MNPELERLGTLAGLTGTAEGAPEAACRCGNRPWPCSGPGKRLWGSIGRGGRAPGTGVAEERR